MSADRELPRLTNEEIDQVWQSMPGGPTHWLKGFGYQNFARAIEDEIALNVSRRVSGWVSCKDAVPDVGQVVLVACEGWNTPAVLKYQVQPYQRFIDQSSGRWWWHHEAMNWMPLPEAP